MKKKLRRKKPRLPLLYRIIRGGIGKDFVIKHYGYGPIRTKFPDMSRIVASVAQRKCRDRFKKAVQYANTIMADPVLKAGVRKRIRRKHGVFNAVIKEYMLREKRQNEVELALVNRMLYKALHRNVSPDIQKEKRELIIYNPVNAFIANVDNSS